MRMKTIRSLREFTWILDINMRIRRLCLMYGSVSVSLYT
jgi:hypothetical protein